MLPGLLRGFLGFGVPVGFWDLFLKYREPRFFLYLVLPEIVGMEVLKTA